MKTEVNKKWQNFVYLLRVLWGYDKKIILRFFECVLVGAAIPYIAILTPKAVLQLLMERASWEAWGTLLLVVGLGGILLYLISGRAETSYKSRISMSRNGCFGDMLFRKVVHIKYELLEDAKTQELIFRAGMLFWSDNSGMAGVFENLRKVVTYLLTASGLVVILIQLHPLIPLVLVLTTAFNLYLIALGKKQEDSKREEMSKMSREKEYLDEVMQDVVWGKDIRLFGLMSWLTRWYDKVTGSRRGLQTEVQRQYTKYDLLAVVISALREAVTYGYLIWAAMMGRFQVDDFVLFFSSSIAFTSAIVSIVESFFNIRQFLGHTEDFRNVMDLPEEVHSAEVKETAFSHLGVKDLFFRYPNAADNTLRQISFDIKSGEHVAVVGVNGAGKSTLVKLLVGLYTPTGGSIAFYGDDGKEIPVESRSQMFSAEFQKPFQYAMTLGENVAYTDRADIDQHKLAQAIETAGLAEDVSALPNKTDTMLRKDFDPAGVTLSGGQLQKLVMARILYRNAPIVILDEPTAALDALMESQIYQIIAQQFSEKTCVFISHRLSSVIFCDKIILMDQGRILDCAPHETLLQRSELYARLWEAQSQPYKEGEGDEPNE